MAAGGQDTALYRTLGVPIAILPLSLLVRLVRAVREPESARSDLVREAIVRERLRIDDDLRATVATAPAAHWLLSDPSVFARHRRPARRRSQDGGCPHSAAIVRQLSPAARRAAR